MNAPDGPQHGALPENQAKAADRIEWFVRVGLLLVALMCVAAAVVHAVEPSRIDQTTGILLALAAAILVFREVSKLETPWFKMEKVRREMEDRVTDLLKTLDDRLKSVDERLNKEVGQVSSELKAEVGQVNSDLRSAVEDLRQVNQKVNKVEVVQRHLPKPGAKASTPPPSATAEPQARTVMTGKERKAKKKGDDEWNDDPNKHKFGMSPVANGRVLKAKIKPLFGDDDAGCEVTIWVESTDPDRPLTDEVIFHLHPSFGQFQRYRVDVKDGVATDTITSWGAFTIGVEADGGETRLELDLMDVTGGTTAFYKA